MPRNTLIQLRNGSTATWTNTNPVLASGEPGFDLNNILKIGDGQTPWSSLPPVNSGVIPPHSEINLLSLEPQGFVNRLDSNISFNDSTRTFTIQPTGSSYDVYIEGVKFTKTSGESVVIGTGTALNYIHFDTTTKQLEYKTTPFDFDYDVPIAFIHWNADIGQSTFFGEERHGIRMDSNTHKWIHNTFGMQYINGLSIGGYTLLGDGSSNSHAQISISNGTLYQEDIVINIADGDNGIEFTQQLDPIAYIPTYYHSGSTGQWVRASGTPYPVKYNATRAQYNLLSGGTWTTPNVTNNRYFAMWLVATNDMNDPILAIVGQREDSSLGSAENNNIWSDLNLTNIPTSEYKPLYRLIFVTNDTFANTPKSSLQSILDLRESVSSTINGVTQNDHGLLFGLGDDDHSQYIHINNARTITATHSFSNGLTITNGLLSATSGLFSRNITASGFIKSGGTSSQFLKADGSIDSTNYQSYISDLNNLYVGFIDGSYVTSDDTLFNVLNSIDEAFGTIANDSTIVRTTGTQTITGNKTFSGSTTTVFTTGAKVGIGTDSPSYLLDIYDDSFSPFKASDSNNNYIAIGPPEDGTNVVKINAVDKIYLTTNTGDISITGTVSINGQTLQNAALGSATNGQLLIGNGSSFSKSTLTAGTGISITNGAGSITINTSGLQTTITNPVTGTGVANHIPYWSSTSGLLADSSQLVWDSTNDRLGIGTSSPTSQLHVIGTGNFTQALQVNGTGVSISGHAHTSSNITDFSSSVSGLLPVKNIIAGTNINISSSSGTYTINSTAAGGAGLQSSSYVSQGKLSGNQSVASGGDAVIQFVDDYDPQSWFNTTTRRFQPNIAGYYLISVGAWMDDADTTNGQANVQIRLNNNTILLVQNQLNDVTGLSLTGSKAVYLNGTTDYIDFTFYHSTGSSRSLLSGGDGTWFTSIFLAWSAPPIGTENYISKFGTSGSGVINSLIYDDGTNVGIGTSSPAEKLDIDGTIKSLGFKSYGLAWIGSSDGSVGMGVNDNPEGTFGSEAAFAAFQGFNVGVTAYNPLCITAGYSPQLYLNTDGNVGIGTATPSETLDVDGNLKVDGNLTLNNDVSNNEGSKITVDGAGITLETYSTQTIQLIAGTAGDGVITIGGAGGDTTNLNSQFTNINGWTFDGDNVYNDNGILRVTSILSSGDNTNTNTDLIIGDYTKLNHLNWNIDQVGDGVFNSVTAGGNVTLGLNATFDQYGLFSTTTNPLYIISDLSAMQLVSQYGITMEADVSNIILQNISAGNVGIGTNSPSVKLDVNGDTNIDGNLTFDSYTESVVSNGNSGTSKTLSLASGTVHTCTLTGNCTFTMPTATAGKSFTMFLNSGSGNYTATFTGVRWADSATPTATITASKVDIYSFISDGTYWYGSFSQNYG